MNSNEWKGKWKQLEGEVRKKWGNLTDDELEKVKGDRKKLEGLIQEKCGLKQEETKRKLDEIEKRCCDV